MIARRVPGRPEPGFPPVIMRPESICQNQGTNTVKGYQPGLAHFPLMPLFRSKIPPRVLRGLGRASPVSSGLWSYLKLALGFDDLDSFEKSRGEIPKPVKCLFQHILWGAGGGHTIHVTHR